MSEGLYVLVDPEVYKNVVSYLSKQPYNEVFEIINSLQNTSKVVNTNVKEETEEERAARNAPDRSLGGP